MQQISKIVGTCVYPGSTITASVPILSSNKLRTFSTGEESGGGQTLLSRTLGSISSLGSFTHSPNFSSLVDFSTGLFVRSQDEGRVKDISEVDMATPPRPEFVLGDKGPDWSVEIGGNFMPE